MGVVQRQSIKQSMVTYGAIVVGAVNTLIIYPYALEPDELGIIPFVTSLAALIFPIAMLGASSLVVRYFPVFKDEPSGHRGFLFYLFLHAGLGLTTFLLIALLFYPSILDFYGPKSPLYRQFLPYVIPLVFLMAFSHLLSQYASNFLRIVVPAIFNNLFLKIVVPCLVLLYFFGKIPFVQVFNGLVVAYALVVLILGLYLRSLGQLHLRPNWSFFKPELKKEMNTYAGYGLLGSLGTSLATRIDLLMIGSFIELSNVASYSIAFFMAEVIDVPRRAIENIANPILAQASKDGDKAKILELYQKTALNQLIVGLFLLIGIWASIDLLFAVMPNGEKYVEGKYVVLLLGLGTLIDLATGVNSHIIGYSRFFRFNFFLILLMAVVNIGNNFLFIPIFFINGAALATLISKSVYNGIKTFYVWRKMQIHPFSRAFLKTILIGVVAYGAAWLIPVFSHPILIVFLKSVTILVVYGGLMLAWRVSEDINDLVLQGWKKLRGR